MLKELLDFILSKTIPLSDKFWIGFVVVIGLFIVNDEFGFTFYLNKNKKLNILEQTEKYLSDSAKHESTILYADRIRCETMARETFRVRAWRKLFYNLPVPNYIKSAKQRSIYLTAISAFSLLIIIRDFIAIYKGQKRKQLSKTIVYPIIMILASILMWRFGLFICSIIPQIKYVWINYMLNGLIMIWVLASGSLFVFVKELYNKVSEDKK